jgi:uncharacterized protein YccT (UPF0319 family)
MSVVDTSVLRAKQQKAFVKFTAIALGLTASITAAQVWADAEIVVPESVVVVGIDGQETGNTGFFTRKHTSIHLPAGEHTITARYDRLYQLNADEHEIVRSKAVTIRAVFADQQGYVLGWAPEPDSLEEAHNFIKQPTLVVKAPGGQVVASQKGALNQSTSLVASVMQGYNNLTTSDEGKTDALQHLQSLWGQATTQQRKQFKQWLTTQPD